MASKPFITINDLSHAFGAGVLKKEVLQGISIDFYPGEIVIIMGPSGSGKTTLLTLAGALRTIQHGSVRVDGVELYQAKPDAVRTIRRKIGFIFQAHNLVASLTVCENVQLALTMDPLETAASSREKALHYLNIVGLAEHAHKKPDELSGGQKQRVAVARALVRRPGIIMADEPTAALDKKTGREVVELLQRLARQEKAAVLLVTHDNRILDVADRIITLDDGRIEETHRGMERFLEALQALVALYPRYAATISAPTGSDESLSILQRHFRELREPLFSRAAEFTARRMSALLMEQARSLEKLLHNLGLCEETLVRLLVLFSSPPSDAMRNLGDSFFQPLEFLLTTMAETAAAPAVDSVDMLMQLTEDRGALMTSLREKYFDHAAGFDEDEKCFLFEMTELFARMVYLIHDWTASWRIWTIK